MIESVSVSSAAEVANLIVSASSVPLRVQRINKKIIRLAPVDPKNKFDDQTGTEIIKSAGFEILKVIPKGDKSKGALSGRFTGYEIAPPGAGDIYNVVFVAGANKGQQFESDIANEARRMTAGEEPGPALKSLLQALGLEREDIADVVQTGAANSKRPFGPEPINVGEKISDITFILQDGEEVFVSLKNELGLTFANIGAAGAFIQQGETVVSAPHKIDHFLEVLGVDKDLACERFTNYIGGAKDDRLKVDTYPDGPASPGTVLGYLAAGYGWGYWYAQYLPSGWKVKNISSPESLKRWIGDVKNIQVAYPGPAKDITCSITTTSGIFLVQVRNTRGGIIPNTLTIKKQKTF